MRVERLSVCALGIGVGVALPVGVGVGVTVAPGVRLGLGEGGTVGLGVDIGVSDTVGDAVAVAVAVGVGVGVTAPSGEGPWISTVIGVPVLKKPIVAFAACGGRSESKRKLYIVPKRIAFAFWFCAKVSELQLRASAV
jgi:hypothetical protein